MSLARFLAAREINVITPRTRFRLFRIGTHWPPGGDLPAAIQEVQRALVQEVQALLEDGRIAEAQAELLFYRILWERVAARFPFQVGYSEEER